MTAPIAPTTSATGTGSSSPSAALSATSSLDQDAFLKLLVAQMKNQDPTNPMQAQDLAAQLAQFSSLNQLISVNSALATQNEASQGIQQAVTMNTATATLGRTVTAVGNQVAITNGTAPDVTFDVGGTGGDATVHVYNASGVEVASEHLGALAGGRHTSSLGSVGAGLTSGAYTYSVDVTDSSGNPVGVTTYTVGKIDSLQATANGPVLGSGPLTIPFGSVVAISGS
jgi:flagellar basal-body rod modification protein FlgD